MKKRSTVLKTIPVILISFGLAFETRAISPAPDGGYPGANTAEGQNALFGLTTGAANTAVGWFSLKSNTGGTFNTALGAGALLGNTADNNTAIGAGALFSNTAGDRDNACGAFALFSNNTGGANNAMGYKALFSNQNGSQNNAHGDFALFSNVGGQFNTAIGGNALVNNVSGNNNTAVGLNALQNSRIGSNNIALGFGAGSNIVVANDTICIGAPGVDVTDGCYIGHVFEEPLDPDNLAMAIDVNGKVGTLPSSRRFKDNIKPMDKTSEAILALKPVTFHYKNDKKCREQFGLIAEEVAKINPELVALDKEGKPFSVRYDKVNAMLLNEFLKEHRKVQEQAREIHDQKAQIRELKDEMAAVVALLKEQDSKIQGVSAQVEMAKSAAKLVAVKP